VLDGAVLVVSAVEGVQAQTRILMRTLRAAGVPTLLFVNKIDRPGARRLDLLADIRRLLRPSTIAVDATPIEWAEILAEQSDAALESYLYTSDSLDNALLRRELATQARAGLVHPVFFGSAITGSGVGELLAGITEFLPTADGDDTGPVDGTVFAIERDRSPRPATSVTSYRQC
jgi:ribosomal protection tetracycline resistance protein